MIDSFKVLRARALPSDLLSLAANANPTSMLGGTKERVRSARRDRVDFPGPGHHTSSRCSPRPAPSHSFRRPQ